MAALRYPGRVGVDLEAVERLEEVTVGRNKKSFEAFETWLRAEGVESSVEDLAAAPSLLDSLLRAFGVALYSSDRPYGTYVHAITSLQARFPPLRRAFVLSWDLALSWHHLEPTEHRAPVPLSLLRAVNVVSRRWGWFRFASVVSCVFFDVFRLGEVVGVLRSALVLPGDVLEYGASLAYVSIPEPKTRRRGGGRRQYAAVRFPLCVALLSAVFGRLPRSSPLLGFSSSAFRRRWDAVLRALGVPPNTYSPGGLRGGGAVAHFAKHEDVNLLLKQMRLRTQATLSSYLQEVTAKTSLASLPALCRLKIREASAAHDGVVRFACLRLLRGDWSPLRLSLLST